MAITTPFHHNENGDNVSFDMDRFSDQLYRETVGNAASEETMKRRRSVAHTFSENIAAEKAKLTSVSKDPAALANLLPKYEELLVRNTFAEKLYGLAADGLERARLRAAAQTIYLDVFVPPALPQDALYPERFASPALISLALAILWGIAALTAALIEDHKI